MAVSKTGKPAIFDQAKLAPASAVMDQDTPPPPAPTAPDAGKVRKSRISGYIRGELEDAVMREVGRRTLATNRRVTFNDMLVEALEEWAAKRGAL